MSRTSSSGGQIGTVPKAEPSLGSARARLLEKVKARLLARGLPRLQMSLIVACTGATGFVVSFLLLHVGLRRLWLRYAVAVVLAYGVFLLLVRFWLALQRRRLGVTSAGDGLNVDLGDIPVGGGSGSTGFSGGGGSFGGGGASAVFEDAGEAPGQVLASAVPSPSSSGSSFGSGFSLDLDLDGDELVVVVVVIAVVGACLAASVYIIVAAPALFAEVLVDGTLSAGLYRHVRGLEEESWLEAAVKRTWIPFAVVGAFFIAAAVVFHHVAPEAISIGDVVHQVFAPKPPLP